MHVLLSAQSGSPAGEGWVAGVSAVSGLLATVLWPAVVLTVVLIFRRPLARFLGDLQQVTVKAPGGAEASLTARAEAAVVAAAVSRTGPAQPEVIERALRDTRAATTALPPNGLYGRTALWVDDNPRNNVHEHEALEALGLAITDSTSSAEALRLLAARRFDVVISDMARPEGPQAGLDLLDEMRRAGTRTPFVIYAGSAPPGDVAAAEARGAYGYTASPSTLVQLVSGALGGRTA